jgi:hypothetical protein
MRVPFNLTTTREIPAGNTSHFSPVVVGTCEKFPTLIREWLKIRSSSPTQFLPLPRFPWANCSVLGGTAVALPGFL